MNKVRIVACLAASVAATSSPALAEGFFSGNWYVTLGGAGISAPTFEGAKDNKFFFSPIISVGRGGAPRFSSRNDNPSFAIYDTDVLRAGVVGKFVRGRDAGDDKALRGLSEVDWGGELGGFADVYVTDWLRARAELRQGIRAHDGLVADIAVDAFTDIAPDLRVSAGPLGPADRLAALDVAVLLVLGARGQRPCRRRPVERRALRLPPRALLHRLGRHARGRLHL